jgi:hypothetical protein
LDATEGICLRAGNLMSRLEMDNERVVSMMSNLEQDNLLLQIRNRRQSYLGEENEDTHLEEGL